jgi:hypothetical protein
MHIRDRSRYKYKGVLMKMIKTPLYLHQDCGMEKESKGTFIQNKYLCSVFKGRNIDI